MKTTKRLLAFVLCFAMLVGLLPMYALHADAAETPLAAAIFGSDIHEESTSLTGSGTSAMKSIMSKIGTNGVTYNTIGFVGDTYTDKAGTMAAMTSAAQTALGQNAEVYYAYGDHDEESDISPDSGLLYSGDYYYIYHISDANMRSSVASQSEIGYEEAIDNFKTAAASMDKSKVLFIMSHVPLHDRRDDNTYANSWYTAIKDVADTMEVVFFWAHNHTQESEVDEAAYYVARDGSEQITIYGGDTVTPNFTYMNAGYIYAAGQNPSRKGVVTTVEIYEDKLVFQDYNSSGEYTDSSYSHNVTVTREFTDSTDSGTTVTKTLSSIAVTTAPTTTVYNVGDTFSSEGLVVTATYSDGSTAAVTGYTLSEVDMTTAGTKTVTVTYTEGDVTQTASFNITVNEVIAENAVLSSITVSGKNEYSLGEALDLTVTAVFEDGTSKTLSSGEYTVTGYDANTTGEQTVTVSYTYGDVTKTAEYTVTVVEANSNEVTLGSSGGTKTVYVLTDSLTNDGNYLIVNVNAAGSGHALGHSGTSVASDSVTVLDDGTNIYIESTDVDTASVWTASTHSSGFNLTNGGYYLMASGSSSAISFNSSSTSSRYWNYSGDDLGCYGGNSTHYIYYSNGFVSAKNNGSEEVYIYQEKTISTNTEVTYTMRAENLTKVVTAADETAALDYCLQGNGADLTTLPSGGSYSFTVLSDESGIISGDIASDGSFTFSGTTGKAKVKVAYTWTADDGNTYTVYKNITVEATEPYYSIDLHKANTVLNEVTGLTAWVEGTTYYTYDETTETYTPVDTTVTTTPDSSVTYYYVTYELGDEITAPIAIKGIEEGDRYGVWAVVKYYDGTSESGTELGSVGSDIEWSSSDESIATIDPVTGVITFTGKEGAVQITATYLNGNKPSDTITISATASQYSVPSDGTNDFPEYPNEGAIRYDKTATAVGNFSETGIAQVELSMTGVPYSSGSEIDVVVMLDMSTSMDDDRIAATVAATKVFIESIVKNTDGTYNKNRIYVGYFNGDTVYTITDSGNIGGELATVDNDTEYNALIAAIEDEYDGALTASGTNYDVSLEKCYNVLTTAKTDGTGNNRDQFVLFMSDGGPTDYATSASNVVAESTVVTWFDVSDSDSANWTNSMVEEYWSGLMKDNGVSIYSVGLILQEAPTSGPSDYRSYSADQNYYVTSTLLTGIASGEDYFINCESATDTADMEDIFSDIAVKILQAATDITVEDQITDEYTMIFDIPTDTNYNHTISTTQEFYIEFLKYTLDDNHERVDTDNDGDTYDDATSVTKLYLIDSNGTTAGGTYSAGSSATTAYDAPVFAQTTIGDKGTLYYWTIDEAYASKAAVTYTNSDDTYYFIPYGMEANEDGTAPDNWYNMTSGAYAYGTIDEVTNTSTDLVIATPYFVYNASTKMLYWAVDKLDTAEYALRYFLYLDDSATDVGETTEVPAATYPTNDHAYITYTNFRGNDCQQKFPIPQLTWNGAQVSYVFYLVNAAGQPINKSGQVVDFANAVFVTDVYTKAVVWNKSGDTTTGTGDLSADWLANDLLPDEYTIYDEQARFTLNVYEKADGTTIKNQFTIDGGTAAEISDSLNSRLDLETTASTVSVATTKVYNTKAGLKVTGYGEYDSATLTGIDFSNTTVAFAVVWESKLVEDVVVVDYGLDVLINVVQNDLLQNTVSGIGVGNSAYGSIEMNTGVIATSQLGTASLTIDGNTISIENENAVRFHQGDMEFKNPVKFYYESPVKFYEDSEAKTGYMYSSVTVIPATTIYYEDEYVDLKTYEVLKNEDGTIQTDTYGNPVFDSVGTNGWDTNSVAASATQQQDRPGTSQIAAALDADNNYGYDAAYASMSSHSMNNAAMINVNAYKKGEATFTFYGTGFDIISVTSNMTGTLMVQVTGTVAATGATYRKNLMVDTYYGYTQNADGEWVTEINNPNALYQVPVIKLGGLEFGQYTVKLVAAYSDAFAHNSADNYDLYLDAIRIYDPTGNQNADANAAYVKDGEGWPIYKELRNLVITANTFGSYLTVDSIDYSDVTVNGAVFIDSDDTSSSIDDYTSYGPNNELYLAPGQAVAFEIADAFVNSSNTKINPVKVQLAIKTVGTSDAKVEIFNPSISTSTTTEGTTQTTTKTFVKGDLIAKTISTATDMYYDITDLTDDVIVISNPGEEGIVSITNIKFTFGEAASLKIVTTTNEDGTEETSEASVASISEEGAVYSLRSLRAYSVSETVETETEPTEPETEATEPETEATEPETEATEPETEATEPETEATEPEDDESDNSGLVGLIKKLLGWLFG